MKPILITGLALLCLSIGNLCAQKNENQHAKSVEQLKEDIMEILNKYEVPGAGIAMVHKDSIIWAGGLGMADIEGKTAVNGHSVFRVGSITKSFVALGILKLVDEGKLNLDDKLTDIASEIEFDNPWKETAPLRLVHLLEHTSGFDDMHFNEMLSPAGQTLSAKEALAINPNSRKVRWRPGTRASYSNPGYAMAGYILEKYSGQRFEDYLKTVILGPLAMNDASFEKADLNEELLVKGYKTEGQDIVLEPYVEILFRWAGSLNASALDIAKFTQFFLNRGQLNGQALWAEHLIDRMETVTSTLAAKQGLNLGYGLANISTVKGKHYKNGHDGGINGFISRFRYINEAEVGYVILLNAVSGAATNQISGLITDFLIAEEKATDKPFSKTAFDAKSFVGYYKNASPRNQVFAGINSLVSGVRVFQENDTLFAKGFMQDRKALIPVGTNLFRFETHAQGHLMFTKNAEGQAVMIDADSLGEFYEKSSSFGHGLILITTVTALGLLLSFIPVWIVRKVFFGIKKRKYPSGYVNEFAIILGAISLILAISGISNLGLDDVLVLGSMNGKTLSFFLCTLGLALFLIAGIVLTVRHFREKKSAWNYYLMALALGNLEIVILFYQWDLIGLRTWAW